MDDTRMMNLIVGGNGVGKTSLLEAICLFRGRSNPRLLWHPDIHRLSDPYQNPLEDLAKGSIEMSGVENGSPHHYKVQYKAVKASYQSRRQRSTASADDSVVGLLHVTIDNKRLSNRERFSTNKGLVSLPRSSSNTIQGIFTSDTVADDTIERFSHILVKGCKKNLVERIRAIFPIDDIDIVVFEGDPPQIVVTKGDVLAYVESLGGGTTRLFNYQVILYSANNDLVCIDEIENGIHHSTLPDFWNGIKHTCENLNVQTFATTHSYECIRAAAEAYRNSPDDIMIHTLYLDQNNNTKINKYGYDELNAALEMNLEIR